jgi:hypothetical protein
MNALRRQLKPEKTMITKKEETRGKLNLSCILFCLLCVVSRLVWCAVCRVSSCVSYCVLSGVRCLVSGVLCLVCVVSRVFSLVSPSTESILSHRLIVMKV